MTCWPPLAAYRAGSADLSDCLIDRFNATAGCDETLTFDRAAATLPHFALLGDLAAR